MLAPGRRLRHRRWVSRHAELSVEDRRLLTEVILPSVRHEAGDEDVLFVGVEWYTAEYPALFPDGNLVTLDLNPSVAVHGAARHISGDVRQLNRYFEAETFAAILCNGVFGYGVDSPDDVGSALAAMRLCLRPGGSLVIGWNDTDDRRVTDLRAAAMRAGLEPRARLGLASWRTAPIGPLRHVYDVYERPVR